MHAALGAAAARARPATAITAERLAAATLAAREWLAARRAAATAETAAEARDVLRVCAVGLWLWLAEAFGAVRAAVAVSRS